MLRPTLLDDNDTFVISKPFFVSERLDALAYHMSLSPSPSEKCDPEGHLNKSTTEYVEHEECTAKPLHGPPPNFINELLRVAIDFRENSPLSLAMTQKDSCNYFSFRRCLTARTMPYSSIASHTEIDYHRIVDASLHTLIPLAAVLLLQLWIHDGASNDTHAFHMARDTLMHLSWGTYASDSANHFALGPITDTVPSVFVVVERMIHPFVEFDHQNSFKHLPFASPCQDGPPLNVPNAFIDGMPQSDGIPSFCRCHVDIHHLMAQVRLTFL
jgi:hypothetical protein